MIDDDDYEKLLRDNERLGNELRLAAIERDAALTERDALREKQAVWLARAGTNARLQGYRELGAKCAALEGERDALRGALVHIAGADDQTIEEADSGAYLRDMARKAIKKEGR